MIADLYQILLYLGEYILLGGFELGDEVPDVSVVDAKFSRCRSDKDLILDDSHE